MLATKMREYAAHPETEFPVFSSYWPAALAMVRHLFLNPRGGVNAGSARPTRTHSSATDFASDVLS